ncbi:hypothetical protein CUS_6810 [Ruminococcus albus 8]|uniref:Uncharacterized protein n=1 Tax=Ruminococcus albus 8 TaxID=246199 RepID=E9SBZ4_RUMAL|nr:hypothetical protein CUS_6810 [Ruminococcus albus 8]
MTYDSAKNKNLPVERTAPKKLVSSFRGFVHFSVYDISSAL